jgi:hypothetical protein
MEKTTNSDIEVAANFRGITLAEDVPDFEFSFYSELHSNTIYVCSKSGGELINCSIEEFSNFCKVRCRLEGHSLPAGRLCVLAHIKWPDANYKDGIRNDIYRQKLDLIIRN